MYHLFKIASSVLKCHWTDNAISRNILRDTCRSLAALLRFFIKDANRLAICLPALISNSGNKHHTSLSHPNDIFTSFVLVKQNQIPRSFLNHSTTKATANTTPIMLKSPREVISLNPTAPVFNYTQHTARSKSSSFSSATSSSGTSTTTQTSIHSTKFSVPNPNFKESIPQNRSILNFHPTESPLTATSVTELGSSSECSESQLSSGLASSIPSDTTFTTQDGTKPEDMLLSMKYFPLRTYI